ncbi:MAG: BNR repeat-containing protein [Planctomycetaceae bacterium]
MPSRPPRNGCSRLTAVAAVALSMVGVVQADAPAPLDVAPVWSGHPVGFALLTSGNRQLVGFYDAARRLTVAVRSLAERTWTFVTLPRTTGWDSHNYVALAVDRAGFVHLAADMHCSPLVYFRSRHPLTGPFHADSFEPLHRMTGDREDRVTYPVFLHDDSGDLVFMYRHGASGDGDQIVNRYDAAARAWRRIVDAPLTCGRRGDATMNAYFEGPIRGPDGLFHLAWVWRDTPDCDTCHDVCYARSRDLVHWQRSDGTPLDLPITPDSCEVVDPVPAGQGLINGLVRIGFDALRRPVLSYHAYDEAGRSQVRAARLEDGRWRIRQTSRWNHRWEFGGGGTIDFEVGIGPVTATDDGTLVQEQSSAAGHGTWTLDPATLAVSGTTTRRRPAAGGVESTFPGMEVRRSFDTGTPHGDRRFTLRWETLGPNRDRLRPEPWPTPSMLRVIEAAERD